MDKQQIIDDLTTTVEELFETIERVKGKRFADTVRFLHISMHTFRLFSMCLDDEVTEQIKRVLARQFSEMVELGAMGYFGDATKEEQKEMFNWAKQLDERTEKAMNEVNK